MLLLALSAALAADPDPYLFVEVVQGISLQSPNRVPVESDGGWASLSPSALPLRAGVGLSLGGVMVFGRQEWMLRSDPRVNSHTSELRLGAVMDGAAFSDGETYGWDEGGAVNFLAQALVPFVGYRGVFDMETETTESSWVDLPGSLRPVSDGHGVTAGAWIGGATIEGVPTWIEFAYVRYLYAWPRHDRSRGGLLLRGGLALGPLLTGVRIDLDPGTGAYVGFDLGLNGFVNLRGGR